MASGFIGNEVPRKGLRVRVPCPPLILMEKRQGNRLFPWKWRGFVLTNLRCSSDQLTPLR